MNKQINITFLDNKQKKYPINITGLEIAKDISLSLAKKALAIKINDKVAHIETPIISDSKIEIITEKNPESQKILNLTMALVIGQSLLQFNNKIKIINIDSDDKEFAIDFDVKEHINQKDLLKIKEIVNKLITKKIEFKWVCFHIDSAKKQFKENEYILEKLNHLKKDKKCFYTIDNKNYFWKNGVIMLSPILTNNFEILNLSGVFWNNNNKNKQIQRIVGVAKFDRKELNQYLEYLDKLKETDHRHLGKKLELFMFDKLSGQGFVSWLPNGMIIKKQLQEYLRLKETEYNYLEVATPVVGSIELYKTSGHWSHYQENMFKPINADNEQLILRPMSCPHHCLIYKNKLRSYRDLPLRLCEHELLYRYEASGALTGLERVRAMELTDSHIFCRPDQIKDEFKQIFRLITEVLNTLRIEVNYYSLSLRDPNDKIKYYNDDAMWNNAEIMMREALEDLKKELNINYKPMIGEAAFYGPKLDFQIKTILEHEITVSTIQLDFLLPEKFDLEYIDNNNKKVRPIIIHRGLIGTYERFIATLLEQTKGVLPFWLSPLQITIIPVSESSNEFCKQLQRELKLEKLRVYVDDSSNTVSSKIAISQTSKVPFQLIIGDDEIKNDFVSYREYGKKDTKKISRKKFIKICLDLVYNKL